MFRQLQAAARHLKRIVVPELWSNLTDPRSRRGRRYELVGLVQLLLLGMVTARKTLRDVERLGHHLVCRRYFQIRGAPSDTTLQRVVRFLDPVEVRQVLHQMVLRMLRSKMLPVDPTIGFSQVAIDGKYFSNDPTRLHPDAQFRRNGDSQQYQLHALRAALVSTAIAPTIDQLVLPRGKGEAPLFWPFVRQLLAVYGRSVVQVISIDAGFCNLRDLTRLAVMNIGFIAAIKGNWPTLHRQALESLGEGEQQPPMGWELEAQDKRGGKVIRRWFARHRPEGGLEFGTILELWRVRKEVRSKDGVVVEDRYFAVRLPHRDVSAQAALAAVRAHWGIENKSNWLADAVWREDDRAWVRQDKALETLALLRLIAINVVRAYRNRALRSPANRARPFAEIIEQIFIALVRPDVWRCAFS